MQPLFPNSHGVRCTGGSRAPAAVLLEMRISSGAQGLSNWGLSLLAEGANPSHVFTSQMALSH